MKGGGQRQGMQAASEAGKSKKKKKGRESFSPTVSIKEHSPADTWILVQQDLHHTSDLYTGLEDNNFVLRH